MPFQSDKQRRYLWANEPEIAREWTDRYGARGGGIMRIPFANGSFNTNLLTNYLQNDPLRDIYNLDPSVIKSFAQDTSPRAAQAAKDAAGYTRPYGDDPNLFIKNLDKFGMQPRGPLYGKPTMIDYAEENVEDFPNASSNLGLFGRPVGVDKFGKTQYAPMSWKDFYTREGRINPEVDEFGKPKGLWSGPTITERNKRIAETIGHEARHQLLGKNPEFYEDIDDSLVANIGATGTDKHEILNRMLDFQAYNDPDVYKDIYEDMHGNMPRHLSSPIADKFYDQSTAFTNKMLNPYGTTLPNRRRNEDEEVQGILKSRRLSKKPSWKSKMGRFFDRFRGPQLTPQQKQMNTNFMTNYGVTRAPPTMGGRMVGGPFAGMNAPGTSALGSKTSQEMAQKWALKNQHRQYKTPEMQQKQQNIINIATGGRDPGTGTTVTGHGKSGMGRDPSDRMARGGIAGLWPR